MSVTMTGMKQRAVDRLDQLERENEIDWPALKGLSEGSDPTALQVFEGEVQGAVNWWRSELRQLGLQAEQVERLVGAYAEAFWVELRRRVLAFGDQGGCS